VRSTLLLLVIWGGSIATAFFAGTFFGEVGGRGGSRTRVEEREVPVVVRRSKSAQKRGSGETVAVEPPGRAIGREPYVEEEISFEGVETVADLSDLLMEYARRKLRQGPEGHRELYRTFCELRRDRRLRALVRHEDQLMPHAYEWLRFAMDHERYVVDMMETLYETAAENPGWCQGLDDDPLEFFTEGLAVLLPGAVGADRLDGFRGHVRAILEADEKSQPKAVRGNRHEFEENLEMWGGALTPEEVAAALADPATPDREKLELIRSVPAKHLAGVDVAGIVAREFERGNLRALRALRDLELGPGELVRLDRAFVEGMNLRDASWWRVGRYVRATERETWAQVKPLVERGLRRGGVATEKFAQALSYVPERPPPGYVRNVLAAHDLPDNVVRHLRRRFELGD